MDSIEPQQTIYLYHPSINQDSDLLKDYNEFYQPSYPDDEEKAYSVHSRAMSISYQSYGSMQSIQDMDEMQTIEYTQKQNQTNDEADDMFFNSLNLYFAYDAAKYGIAQDLMENVSRSKLMQLSHSILVWGLRQMDDLWQQKPVQDLFRRYMEVRSFTDKDITDAAIFGNKLSTENVRCLIEYRSVYPT